MFKLTKEQFLTPLNAAVGIVERKHTLPILSNIVLQLDHDTVQIGSTDIEIQIQAKTQIEEKFSNKLYTTVNARKLTDIVRSLADKAIIQIDADDKKLNIKSGKSRFSLQTMNAEDYPKMSHHETVKAQFPLSSKNLKKILGNVFFAMAQQDIRYYLNGLLLTSDGNQLKAVATDGHRLAYAQITTDAVLPAFEVIVPRKSIMELIRLCNVDDESLMLSFYEGHLKVQFPTLEFLTKLIEGKFPDYKRVIPNQHKHIINIDRAGLASILNRVAIFTNEKFNGIKLLFDQNVLRVSARNSDQEDAFDEIEIDYQGEAIDIGFNVNYLQDMLSNVADDAVHIKLNDAQSSAMFTLVDNEEFKYVVMPMRI